MRVALGKVEAELESTNRLLLSEWSQVRGRVKAELEKACESLTRLRQELHGRSSQEWQLFIQWMDQPLNSIVKL